IFEGEAESSKFHKISTLDYITTYYWRVRASNSINESDWSAAWQFSTTIKPPGLVTPSDSAYNIQINAHFEWLTYQGADFYYLQVAADGNFSNIIFEDSTLTSNTKVVSGLDYYEKYFWRVRIKTGGIIGIWSAVRIFHTELEPPSPDFPADDAKDLDTKFTMYWSNIKGADRYILELSTNSKFSSTFYYKEDIGENQLAVLDMDYNTTYYWHVKSANIHGESVWSSVRKFTTVISDVEDNQDESQFLINIYPNPAIEKINIDYYLVKPSDIIISIADIDGKHIFELARGTKISGIHHAEWNPSEIANGCYLITFELDKKKIIRKIIILK
ncbi:MAG: large repetitive protein, partial [Bacteroidota bacterium]|nr:large repetitive protein [Bacteroidota bacterium]